MMTANKMEVGMNVRSRKPVWVVGMVAAALAFESFAGAVSESFTAFLRPDESSFWRTAPSKTVTVPIDWPEGASAATLTVTGLGYSHVYTDISGESYTFDLPDAVDSQTENVYDLTLAFNDADTTMRTAKLGLIAGLTTLAEGTTRCRLPVGSRAWNKAGGLRAVLPIPYGTVSFTVNGVETDTGLGGAQGWYALDGLVPGRATELALSTDEGDYSASLFGAGGILLLVR